ncbi:unnamed protein product [Penicillium pancosmium]
MSTTLDNTPFVPSGPAPSAHNTSAQPPVGAASPITVDNFDDDTNSEFDDALSDLTSLSSSVLDFEYENGRRYCSTRSTALGCED